jgi:O-antigen ligase
MRFQENNLKFLIFLIAVISIFIFSVFSQLTATEGLILFLLVLLGALLFLKPFLGLLIIIFLRPAIDLLGTSPILERGFFSALNYNSIFGLLVVLWGGAVIIWKRKRLYKVPAFYLISGFGAISLISIFWMPQPMLGLREIFRLLSIFVIYLTSFLLIKSRKDLKKLLYVLISSSIIPLIVAFWQYFVGKGEVIFGEFFRRLYGTFFYPNNLAFFLVFIMAVLLLLLYWSEKIQTRIFYSAIALVCLFVLLGTYTRGAWMGALMIFFIFGLLKFRKALLIGILFLILAYIFVPILQERIGDIATLEPFSSLMWRFRLWKNTIPFFFERPILGHGLSSFQVLSRDVQGLSLLPAPEAHNDYLKILIETGIVGLIIYISTYLKLLVFNLGTCFKGKDKYLKDISFLAVLLLATFLVMAFGDNILRGTATQWALFAYLGGVSSLNIKAKKQKGL